MRGDRSSNAALIKRYPKLFFSPAYIGPRGYLGVRLDVGRVDWDDVAKRVGTSYRSVAPKRIVNNTEMGRAPHPFPRTQPRR
jgi:hypothetical protein